MSEKKTKNSISNSMVNAGGNMHIGDIINIHLAREFPDEKISFTTKNAEEIKTLISKGELEKAIDLLLGYAKGINASTFNEIIVIARQWEEIQRDIRIGVLSIDDKFRLVSRITYSLLATADSLQKKST